MAAMVTSNIEVQFVEAATRERQQAEEARLQTLAHVGATNFNRDAHSQLEPDDWRHTDLRDDITAPELQLAKRCHGAHIESLTEDITPVASHYQLIHYDIPFLKAEAHNVKVTGLVEQPLSLSMKDIKSRPSTTQSVLLACAGIGRMSLKHRFWTHVPWGVDSFGCAEWTGCSLADVLHEAGIKPEGKQVVFKGADRGIEGNKAQHFERSMSVEDALSGFVLLAYHMNGVDLPPAHGAPVRLIVPGWYGMASVKWLTNIEVTDGSWWGHQMEAYSFRRAEQDTARVPLTRLPVRALMAPPGIPDFFSRTRVVTPGVHTIAGRAWAGAVELDRVEFSSDNGDTWVEASIEEKTGPFGWAKWTVQWSAESRRIYVLCCRAFDRAGRSQDLPSDAQFNWTGMGDTQPQMVYVKVDGSVEQDGGSADLAAEQRAAKSALNVQFGQVLPLPIPMIDALYRQPGSQ